MPQVTRAKTAAQKKATDSTTTPSQNASTSQKNKQRMETGVTGSPSQQAKLIEARKYLSDNVLMDTASPCNPDSMAKVITTVAGQPGTPVELGRILVHLATMVASINTQCSGCAKVSRIPEMLEEMKADIQMGLEKKMESLSKQLDEKISNQGEPKDISDKLEETAKNLSEIATGLEEKITKVTDSTTQLANTATTYRDALLNKNIPRQTQGESHNPDPALNVATSRKVRQVMIQLSEQEAGTYAQETLLEKATSVINNITHPPPPEGILIMEVVKLRKGAILLVFNSKEAADWLQTDDAELEFTTNFIPGCTIKPRQYALLAPRIPLTFDPANGNHLREIEEANGLGKDAIAKARWIKPPNRRKEGQAVAHATIIFNAAKDANKCISEGLLICGAKVYPSKLKQEPTQCMKCRKWGHYATECGESRDTCGTCGGEHRTNTCTVSNTRYCVSCNTSSHASWDRNCPEFKRKCDWYDEKHPENLLKYFPTDDAWTHEVRPERIPIPERFPARYAVGSLPPPNRAGRDRPTRLIERRRRGPRSHANDTGSQPREERHLPPSQRTAGVSDREEGEISLRNYHTPDQTPARPENWDDASSIDFNDPLN